ncbi:MAG: bifunctional isocitrate dehydrogenase kinase/phosphatase [Woeseiaceae bacterium]|nr:bifunctional isocitrate dehydrogenase kinase/phosphatase [Woeseiaceae bacterium]
MPDPHDSVDEAESLAAYLVDAFIDYNNEFREITRRARRTFEERNWAAARHDAVQRIDLYDSHVKSIVDELTARLGDRRMDRRLWADVKDHYTETIREYPDDAFFKTFFSSITRRLFQTIGVDPSIEFTAFDIAPPDDVPVNIEVQTYQNRGNLELLIDQLLADYPFSVPCRDRDRTVEYIAAEIEAYFDTLGGERRVRSIDMLTMVFYRSTRAMLVGRIDGNGFSTPFIVALRNTDEGVVADTVILTTDDASMVFGYTRSYFHADIGNVSAAVAFLRTFLAKKPLAEIYTVLGRAKQGKTERYRAFFQHLENSEDAFTHALGDKGMVMEVFTLPSADIVFKVIRDRFAYPKTIGRKEVMEKYELVFKHDRAGRLVDAQEFKRLRFPKHRFDRKLAEDLLSECGATCRIEDDHIVVEHCYIERRLTPLNLYLESAPEDDAKAAAVEYGQAIRDLAMSNIFAGDLLLKNFGLTRHGRVIFYDYDELCLVTECNFRRLPEPQDDMDEMRSGAWFYVGPNDVFPEQFIEFLGFKPAARQAFLDMHGDLLTPEFWNRLKRRFEAGEIIDVLPYTRRDWTAHRGTTLVPARAQPRIRNESA